MRYIRARNAAILLGLGLGGFVDGIVLHQILHWHNMLSARIPPETVEALQRNMVADGLFHLATWAFTLAGVLTLWSATVRGGRLPATRTFLGYMVVGWGVFNFVEGAINHHVLQLHHVRDLPVHMPVYDWIFLIVGGIGFIFLGLALRDGREREPAVGERRSGFERRTARA